MCKSMWLGMIKPLFFLSGMGKHAHFYIPIKQHKVKALKGEVITKIAHFLFSALCISFFSTLSDTLPKLLLFKSINSVLSMLFIDTWLWVISLPRIDAGQGKERTSHLFFFFFLIMPDQIYPPLCGLTPSHHDEPSFNSYLSSLLLYVPHRTPSLFILLSQFATDSSER